MSTVIDIKDLTEGLQGTGVFDQLMESVKGHLQEEFSKGRITGPSYSNVYLGGLTAVMQQSIEFLLRKDLTAKQVDLAEAQIANTVADTAYKVKQTEIADEQLKIAQQEVLIKIQELAIAQQEVLIKTKQVELATKELELKDKEIEIASKQLLKLDEEIELLKKQGIKTQSEIDLLNAKTDTEKGQTTDVNSGLVGAQRRLYDAQTTGFSNDHTYKMTKIRADIYSTLVSTDPDANWTVPPPNWVLG